MSHFQLTSLLECEGQREEIRGKEAQARVLHVVSDDWDQPAARELQVIADQEQKRVKETFHQLQIRMVFCPKRPQVIEKSIGSRL